MGFFDFFKKPAITPEEYIIDAIKHGITYGRQIVDGDTFHIEKKEIILRPSWGVSSNSAQTFLATASLGTSLYIKAGTYERKNAIIIESKTKQFVGNIFWSEYIDSLQMIYDMLLAGVQIDCTLFEKKEMFSDQKNSNIWWCSIALPSFDFWGEKDADVWTTPTGKYYHMNEKCSRAASMHMRKAEAERRLKEPCPKCCINLTC